MFAIIGSYLKRIPQLVGVELLLADEGTFEANLAVVKRAGNKVRFVRGEYGLTTLGAISQHVTPDLPLVLAIGGKGVIHRIFHEERQSNDIDLIKQLLPNAKLDDFYFQRTTFGGRTVLSVVRRAVVDSIVAQFGAHDLALLAVDLGPFAVDLFRDYFPEPEVGVVTLSRHRFIYQGNVFGGYELVPVEQTTSGKRMDIAGEQLNERLVAAFAVAFAEISDIPLTHLKARDVIGRANDHRQRWAFKRSGVILMVLFLMVLLLNAGCFMYYSEKVAGYAGTDGLSLQNEIEVLQRQSDERSAFLEGLWPSDAPRWGMAYMADRIAGALPQGIRLDEMAIYPKDEALSRKQRRPVHTPSAIHISGTCMDMPQLNRWIKQIRTLAFCRSVQLSSYTFDERDGIGIFGLQLTLEP